MLFWVVYFYDLGIVAPAAMVVGIVAPQERPQTEQYRPCRASREPR